MGTPTKKRTSGQKRRRAKQLRLTPATLSRCPKCHKAIQPHRACTFCGYYRGRAVVRQARVKTAKPKAS